MKKLLFFLVVFCLTLNLKSQNFANDYGEKLYIGGSFGLQFGSITNLSVDPHFGHYIFPKLSLGVGFKYQYYREKHSFLEYTINIYGGRLFARYEPFEKLFAQAEVEMLVYKTDMFSSVRNMETIWSDGLLVGVGYRESLSTSSSDNAYIMLLYNLNHTIYTPYSNPVLRIGFEFYF